MKLFLKSLPPSRAAYTDHDEAVVISCFFNPTRSPYRLKVFHQWYETIKHLNHRIIELAIGNAAYELPESPWIERLRTGTLLWHKETLLNKIIEKLPDRFKYVFWIDADVLFTNKNWLVNSVQQFGSGLNVLQPFEYCVHLNRDETEPSYWLEKTTAWSYLKRQEKNIWRSYSANFADQGRHIFNQSYDERGHVGLAWGARRELLIKQPLFDRALIGGGDGIIAYASAGDIVNKSIRESFKHPQELAYIAEWQTEWFRRVQGKVGYVPGNLYHLWHGDLKKRNYLKRVQDFTPKSTAIQKRDENGFYLNTDPDAVAYIHRHFQYREAAGSGEIKAVNIGGTDSGGGQSDPTMAG
ncbi:hypothetical protein [Spirosoma fluminis]